MTDPGNYQLFVYGSLRSGFQSPAYEYMSRFFSLTGLAKVKGRLFDLGPYSGGVESNDDYFIIGELYSARGENEFAWAMAQLDDYEGISAEPGETALYRRALTDVYIDERVTKAWIYWYSGDISQSIPISSGDLIQYLQQKK